MVVPGKMDLGMIESVVVAGHARPCEEWAKVQLSRVDLGDRRRQRRLEALLGQVASQPGCGLPQQCGHGAPLKGAYRLLQSKHVCHQSVIQSAVQATVELLGEQSSSRVVLAVQDTTTLNFTSHHALSGRGPVGRGGDKMQGFYMHSTLLLGERQLVHGLLECEIYARDAAMQQKRKPGERNRQPCQQKESHRWVRSLERSAWLCGQLPAERIVVNVADREADMYELFIRAQELRQIHGERLHVLVRAQHDRVLEDQATRMWGYLKGQPAMMCWEVGLPHARSIHQEQRRRVEALWSEVELSVPAHQSKYQGSQQPLKLTLIAVREPSPPEEETALEWVLLTTWPVGELQDLRRVVDWYARRWQIEVMHRVLKSGCKVEERRVQEAAAMQVMMTLDLLTAVRIMSLLDATRQDSGAPADQWLHADELAVLRARNNQTEQTPVNMGQAMRWIAQMAGHPTAPSSPPPGAERLWRGLNKLHHLVEGWRLSMKYKNTCG